MPLKAKNFKLESRVFLFHNVNFLLLLLLSQLKDNFFSEQKQVYISDQKIYKVREPTSSYT
jgi:hypothetical protein